MDSRTFLLAIACELAVIMGYVAYTSGQFVRLHTAMFKSIVELGKQVELLRRDLGRKASRKEES